MAWRSFPLPQIPVFPPSHLEGINKEDQDYGPFGCPRLNVFLRNFGTGPPDRMALYQQWDTLGAEPLCG
jgi:hypothetical protein